MPEGVTVALYGLLGVVIVAIIGAIGGFIPAWLRRRTDQAEAADFLAAAWTKLSAAQSEQIDDLTTENKLLRDRVAQLEKRDRFRQHEFESLQRQFSSNATSNAATIEALRVELADERRERRRLEAWVEMLVAQLEQKGITPVPKPAE